MATKIRSEVSERNKYWLPKERFYELKHFCQQYPIWKQAYHALEGLSKRPDDLAIFHHPNQKGNPTEKCVESRWFYEERLKMVEQAALEADADICRYILRGVTEGLSYDSLKMQYDIPCCRETYYDRYRKFFWLLSAKRN